MKQTVKAWEEDIVIPTYGIGVPEKNPIFLEKRVYQGSSGVVYPHPVIEKICNEKKDKTYRACFLENEYLKIMILPELGGRVQMAYDKIKKRHFIYYQDVIKPALVGLTGPWISGGIEFNWPQHHRPSTFEPVDYRIEENPDGSKTVWCNEVERMFRTKGMVGFTLHSGKAYIELNVRLFNRTPFPQTFLWWANPAVHVNDQYQSVFPPDVHAVFDHGRRDVSRFPIATGTYYKVDYSAGVDISWYKNIPVPTSFMAVSSEYDFIGGYEHDSQGGVIHIANHHVSPGKKQWTWGHSDFGQAWDRNLTDHNGPYIEIMCGVFTDNQPDFSWLMPYEEKAFTQYFMPYRDLGVIKNATKEAMLNLEIKQGKAIVKVYTTAIYKNSKVELKLGDQLLMTEIVDLSPDVSFMKIIDVDNSVHPDELFVHVVNAEGRTLVSWRHEKQEGRPLPDAAKAAKRPDEITNIEQLYLTGLHLEQYRHATFSPIDYYKEALKRDPVDVRCNNALGLWYMKRGRFADAEQYFRRAIATLTELNPNPYDGEPYYNLGFCLKMQGRLDEAFDTFYKSVWNAAWQDAGFLSLAQIATWKGNFEEALELVERSLIRNWHNHKSRHIKTVILRKMGKLSEALDYADESLKIDSFNFGCMFEKHLLLLANNKPFETFEAAFVLKEMKQLMRDWVHNFIEYALDYASAGLYQEATQLLSESISDPGNVYPMVYYIKGYFASSSGKVSDARALYKKASEMKPDYCFPNRTEEVTILLDAMKLNSEDAKAPYYLGNFWYAMRQYEEALWCWERSVSIDGKFPTVLRNLSLIYYNKYNDPEKARGLLEKAFELDTSDARILLELDQLYKKMNKPHSERLAFLEQYGPLVDSRDDLYLERVTLYNQLGKYEQAKEFITQRKFHPWEGGEGKVIGQYLLSHIELGKIALSENRFADALELLNDAGSYPQNLCEGKLYGARENDLHYYMGWAYEGLGDAVNARQCFEKASEGISEPTLTFFYNDQQPDMIFYQGLAWKKLSNEKEAQSCFDKLITYGKNHLYDTVKVDYFAVSLPDLLIWDEDLNRRNQIHCTYLIGLGKLGLGNMDEASRLLQEVLNLNINHIGAQVHLRSVC